MRRPDWDQVYKGCGQTPKAANRLVSVSHKTARLAASALREQNSKDYYHNYGAAERELNDVLAGTIDEGL